MKSLALALSLGCLALFPATSSTAASGPGGTVVADDKPGDTFVYADFDEMKDGRPVSKNGGRIQLTGYAQNQATFGKIKGADGLNPPAPELVRTSQTDTNKAGFFGYELQVPNDYAGVTLEIRGHDLTADGKTVPDDLSGYGTLSVQALVEGVDGMRVEIVSIGTGVTKGNDSDTTAGFPQKTFKVSPGMNTYKIKLNTLKQPGWQNAFRVSPKEVLAKLTAVHFAVFCEGGCKATAGRVVIDNLVFEK